ncbi:hypothetical protein FALBO_14981 [Fusarium albosuccineum]|uniref:Uncharacterized protein n=1 Tax=Fusarium albosuccineum TaxID=1237068 RepID=A0A8H4KZJ3_9HYPO|nr:hypothetical protein FALBO_14981 [Fusarium albosuccineum]KAF4988686.1 hypothetical protein FDECE_14959 [Fusarium decemcellulare]
MQLFNALFLALAATSVNAACMIAGSIDPNCCWGGKDNVDACNRQGACNVHPGDTENYCRKFGITPQDCDADCCDTRTKKGKPCPKGRNACDPETGCPF